MTWYPTQIPNIWYVLVAQSCPTLRHLMDGRPPGSSVQGVLQIRIQEWVDIPFSSEFSQPRDRMQVSCIGSRILYRLSYQGREAKKKNNTLRFSVEWHRLGAPGLQVAWYIAISGAQSGGGVSVFPCLSRKDI